MCSSHQELNGVDSVSEFIEQTKLEPAHLKILDENKSIYFHPQRVQSGQHCVACHNAIFGFMDGLSLREFTISGLCQDCQDEVFSDKYEDADFDDNEWASSR